MTNGRFHRLFGGPRAAGGTHRTTPHGCRAVHPGGDGGSGAAPGPSCARLDGRKKSLPGGRVALNCVANGRLLREGMFDRLWIQPAASDAGGALGAALAAWHTPTRAGRPHFPQDRCDARRAPRTSIFGEEIETTLRSHGAKFRKLSTADLLETTVQLLQAGKVIGCSRGGWNSAPGPWATARSWATRGRHGCNRS